MTDAPDNTAILADLRTKLKEAFPDDWTGAEEFDAGFTIGAAVAFGEGDAAEKNGVRCPANLPNAADGLVAALVQFRKDKSDA